ncbi:MAG: phosphoribosylanthranilate isomerase [Alphaproteobacteria bacterium]|nr:phosphoribosylanthranilate isomerase [Alphaproteobacteria bacterium]
MSVDVKICGLNDAASVDAVGRCGARYAGFVFYSKSPRVVTAAQAAGLMARLPPETLPVGLLVDASDDDIADVLRVAPVGILQLHGNESVARVAEVKQKTGLPVMKAVGIGMAPDVIRAKTYEAVADYLLLDAKPASEDMLPGGNARAFDWGLLKGQGFARPWLLAGGLTSGNVAAAVAASDARAVDVSSGVEDAPGHKNIDKIKDFLGVAGRIETTF